jgi:hypothetical protein
MEAVSAVKKNERTEEEVVTCSCCDRRMKNPAEWVRSRRRVICVACYEGLLNPFPKCCSGGAGI